MRPRACRSGTTRRRASRTRSAYRRASPCAAAAIFALARTLSPAGRGGDAAIQLSYGVLGLHDVTTKWRTPTCAHPPPAPQLTDALQQFVSAALVALLLFVVSLPPHRTRAHGALAGRRCCCSARLVAICAVLAAAPCSPASLSSRRRRARRRRSARSSPSCRNYESDARARLDLVPLLLHPRAGLHGLMINMVVNNHDPWTVWMPASSPASASSRSSSSASASSAATADVAVAVADGGASLLQ